MSSMKRKFIINPSSASGNARKKLREIQEYFQHHDGEFNFVETVSRTDITVQTTRAIEEGFEQIVAVGGDGTVNAVANGFFNPEGNPIHRDACLAVVPVGTGSDYFRTLSSNHSSSWQKIIRNPKKIKADLGLVYPGPGRDKKTYFVNMAGVGISAEVAQLKSRVPKWIPKELSYLTSTLTHLPQLQTFQADILLDGQAYNSSLLGAFFSKGKYAGAGMKFGKEVELNDGQFEVTLVPDLSAVEVLKNIPRLFNGTLDEVKGVIKARAKKIQFRAVRPIECETDGEPIGKTPIELEIAPQALWVCASSTE